MTFSRWQLTFNPSVIPLFVNKINIAPFSGAGPFQVLMSGIRSRLLPIAGTKLFWVTYVMKWDEQSWVLFKPDRGHWWGTPSAPIFPAVASARGREHLFPLNGTGGISTTNIPALRNFYRYAPTNFAPLNLG